MNAQEKLAQIQLQVQNAQNNPTDDMDVLQYMYDHWYEEHFMAWEVIHKTNSKGVYLSHRAPARLTDLAEYHPQLVEKEKIGRFTKYRLRVENIHLVEKRLGIK